jgi:hypothetical protein
VGGFIWDAQRRATAVFERHDRLVQDLISEIRGRPASRPRLFDPPLESDGWPHFEKALLAVEAMPQSDSDELPAMNGDIEFRADPEKVDEILQRYASVLEELRVSGRSSRFVPQHRYEDAWSMDTACVSRSLRVARFLSDRATRAHQKIEDGAALESLLLGLSVGHDAARHGPIVSFLFQVICEGIAEWDLRELLAGHSLEPSELESFAGKLDLLWSRRPSLDQALQVEDALIRRGLVDLGLERRSRGKDFGAMECRSWRYLYSQRLAYAGALGEAQRLMERLQALSELPGPQRPAAADKLNSEAATSENPFIKLLLPGLSRLQLRDLVAQMSWTLMRVSVAIAWYESEHGRVPEKLQDLMPRYLPRVPGCPLTGKPLGYENGRVWSFGKNGIDDGGVPGKNNDADDPDGDVVWLIRRE